MSNQPTLLSCHSLSVGYEGKAVLSDINFSLHSGNMAALVGPNGSGKSTLLRTLAALQPIVSGVVKYSDCDVSALSPRRLANLRALVSTSKQGGGALTVREAVAVGRARMIGCFGRMKDNDISIVDDAICSVGMSALAERRLGTLSDGERQKVMIARAIAQDTPLILLDEPTAFLDVAARLEILDLLREIANKGKAILLSTHDIAPTLERSDTIVVVDPEQHTAYAGDRDEIIATGALNVAFAAKNIRFNPDILDFR